MVLILLVVFCALAVVFPINACALNLDYLNNEKWLGNSNVTMYSISKTSIKGELKGKFGYYGDGSDMSVYTYFRVVESTYSPTSDVRIHYTISTADEDYSFSVDENGMCEAAGQSDVAVDVKSNFEYGEEDGCFISGAQYKGGESEIRVKVDFYINGHIYRVKDNINIVKSTDTTEQKTTAANTTKAVKQNKKSSAKGSGTTKFVPRGGGKYSAKKSQNKESKETAKADGTTSFKPSGQGDDGNEGQEKNRIPAYTKTANKLSRGSIILFILATALAVAAVAIIIVAVLKKDLPTEKEEEKTDDENKETEDKEK